MREAEQQENNLDKVLRQAKRRPGNTFTVSSSRPAQKKVSNHNSDEEIDCESVTCDLVVLRMIRELTRNGLYMQLRKVAG